MSNIGRRITIEDVAREAKVSITTVSRVINNNYPVRSETRARVEKAILKLDFNPNTLARSLIIKRTNTLGIVVPSVTNMFFTMVVQGIEKECRALGYTVLLSDSDGDGEREIGCVRNLMSRQVDGLIVVDPATENMEQHRYDDIIKHIPIVFINGKNLNSDMNFVLNDERKGTRDALNYLIDLGHKNIAFIRGSKSYSYDIKEQVYRETMAEHGIEEGKLQVVNIGEGNNVETVDNTSNIVYSMLSCHNKPTAFFACNDLMAVGVLNACRKAGVAVPGDLSIIGFDNIIVSELSQPKLTTVDQNMPELGRLAAEMIIENINNEIKTGKCVVLKTNLIIRGSCASPK